MSMYVDPAAPHLGGYIEGGDQATLYPELWRWLVRDRGVRSVIDVGCGDGVAVRAFRDLGCQVLGVDGVPQEDPGIVVHDYTTGPFAPATSPGEEWDLAWSCEFVEHVEARFAGNYLETFQRARIVLMTHAAPGQPGHHHVNCQPASYWHNLLWSVGFQYDGRLTSDTRRMAAHNPSPWNHFVRSGLAFRARA